MPPGKYVDRHPRGAECEIMPSQNEEIQNLMRNDFKKFGMNRFDLLKRD